MQKQESKDNKLNKQQLLSIAGKAIWEINANSYVKYRQLPPIFDQLQQVPPDQISFQCQVDIVPFIQQNYHFSNLLKLTASLFLSNLDKCFLTNVQVMAKLNAPLLQQLDLSQNLIVEGKALRKCYFPRLKILTINENLIVEGRWLSEFYYCYKFRTLDLEACDNSAIIENLDFIAKINRNSRAVYVESQKRISKPQMIKLLEHREDPDNRIFRIYTYKTHGAM